MFKVGSKVYMRGLTYPGGVGIVCTVAEVLPHAQYRLTWTTYTYVNGEPSPLHGGGVFPEAILSPAYLIAAYVGD